MHFLSNFSFIEIETLRAYGFCESMLMFDIVVWRFSVLQFCVESVICLSHFQIKITWERFLVPGFTARMVYIFDLRCALDCAKMPRNRSSHVRYFRRSERVNPYLSSGVSQAAVKAPWRCQCSWSLLHHQPARDYIMPVNIVRKKACFRGTHGQVVINPFIPKSNQFQISPAASPGI